MSKFTKGKWKYLEALYQVTAYAEGAGEWKHDAQGWATYPDGAWWREITGELCGAYGRIDEEEIHANGRLIASAPEMYRLLSDAAGVLNQLNPGDPLSLEIEGLLACIDGTEAESKHPQA